MFGDTRIDKKLDIDEFVKLIRKHSEEKIFCTSHAFFRLGQKQREIFNSNVLRKILLGEKPFLAGIQYNGNYALFYH